MQKIKLAIMGATRGDIEVREVPATRTHVVAVGHAMYVHRDPRYYDTSRPDHRNYKRWFVSEQTTGNSIENIGGTTRVAAIARARETVRQVGDDALGRAIHARRVYLADHNIVLV